MRDDQDEKQSKLVRCFYQSMKTFDKLEKVVRENTGVVLNDRRALYNLKTDINHLKKMCRAQRVINGLYFFCTAALIIVTIYLCLSNT